MFEELYNLLSATAFKQMFTNNTFCLAQYNAICMLLIKMGIPFDVEFTPGNRREDAELVVTVYVTPHFSFEISFSDLSLSEANN